MAKDSHMSFAWNRINQAVKDNSATINKHAAGALEASSQPNGKAAFMGECEKLLEDIVTPLVTVSMRAAPNASDCISNFMAYIADHLISDETDKNLVTKLAGDSDGFALAMLRYCGSFYIKILDGTEIGLREKTPYDDIPESKRIAIFKLKNAIIELGLFDPDNQVEPNYWALTLGDRESVICWIRDNVRDNKTLNRSEFERFLSICNPPPLATLTDEENKNIDVSDGNKGNPEISDYTSIRNSNLVYSLQLLKNDLISTSKTEDVANRKFDIFMIYLIHKTSDLNGAIDGFEELGRCVEWAGSTDFENKIDSIKATNGKTPTVVDYGNHFGIDMKNYNVALYSALDTLKKSEKIPRIYIELFTAFDPRAGK